MNLRTSMTAISASAANHPRLLHIGGAIAGGAIAFLVADKLCYLTRTGFVAGRGANDVTFSNFFAPPIFSAHNVDVIVGACGAIAVILTVVYHLAIGRNWRRGEEHGSAAWARPGDIRPYVDRDPTHNLLFTATEALSLDTHVTRRNLNALVIGGSGSGKSRFFVMPNLAQANTSFVVTDPKGELLAQCGQGLTEAGYTIKCLNLVDFSASDTFNPMVYFNKDQAEVDVAILANNLITNTTGQRPTGADSFWEKAERALLSALLAFVYYTKADLKTPGTLIDVVDMLARMSASEQDEKALSEIDAYFEALGELLEDFDSDPTSYDEASRWMLEGLRFAHSQYVVYTQGAGETKKSVIISLGVRMAPLHMSAVRRLLSSDTIAADKVGSEKTALFLVIPDTHATFSFLVSIFYEMFFEHTIYLADRSPERRVTWPIQCFMDEFANIGKMPSFERKIAVMRSRGISVCVIMQTYSQGKALYKDDWETIVGNCDSLLFLGGTEQSTTDYISKRLGKQTIDSLDTSETRGSSGSYSRQYRTLGRELLTPDEVGRLPNEECLYLLRGLAPFRSRKLPAPATGVYTYVPHTMNPTSSPTRLDDLVDDETEDEASKDSEGDTAEIPMRVTPTR